MYAGHATCRGKVQATLRLESPVLVAAQVGKGLSVYLVDRAPPRTGELVRGEGRQRT